MQEKAILYTLQARPRLHGCGYNSYVKAILT